MKTPVSSNFRSKSQDTGPKLSKQWALIFWNSQIPIIPLCETTLIHVIHVVIFVYRQVITLPALWGDDPTGLGQRGGSSTADSIVFEVSFDGPAWLGAVSRNDSMIHFHWSLWVVYRSLPTNKYIFEIDIKLVIRKEIYIWHEIRNSVYFPRKYPSVACGGLSSQSVQYSQHRQATSRYLNQWWSSLLLLICVTRTQWVKSF